MPGAAAAPRSTCPLRAPRLRRPRGCRPATSPQARATTRSRRTRLRTRGRVRPARRARRRSGAAARCARSRPAAARGRTRGRADGSDREARVRAAAVAERGDERQGEPRPRSASAGTVGRRATSRLASTTAQPSGSSAGSAGEEVLVPIWRTSLHDPYGLGVCRAGQRGKVHKHEFRATFLHALYVHHSSLAHPPRRGA